MRLTGTLLGLTRSRTPRTQSIVFLSFGRRCNSTTSDLDPVIRLQSDLKVALKSKNSFAATTIRSVLAEVYTAQKQSSTSILKPSDVISIIRKAEQRRVDAARQFESASRSDLAEREQKEATLLASYLPAMMSTVEIDAILCRIIADAPEKENNKKAKGLALKAFYTLVDKNAVSGEIVRNRLDELWSS